jgi:tetratricopeptide (TPR) repeat protein
MNMKSFSVAMLAVLAVLPVYGQSSPAIMTPAQQRISWAQAAIQENPERSQPYNDLAMAYVRRARETADTNCYDQAETALQKSLQISPENLEAQRTEAAVLIGRKEFAKALDISKILNAKMPDDVTTYGLAVDADLALGNYKDAETAAQWMLDLRPGNIPGLLRGARLRRLFGDTEGAMQLYSESYQQVPQTQTEDLAWILTQMADLDLSTGDVAGADKLLQSALGKFPNYYLAVESEASVRMAQQKSGDAVNLLRARNQNFPTLESKYALAKAFDAAGQAKEADDAFADFERTARMRIDSRENANLELIQYYLGRGEKPAEALRIAQIEIARRQDVETIDSYAWALSMNGQYRKAQNEMAAALAVGVRDASFFYHAGAIAARLNDTASAARYLNESLQLNSSSECAGLAREELSKLSPASAAMRQVE